MEVVSRVRVCVFLKGRADGISYVREQAFRVAPGLFPEPAGGWSHHSQKRAGGWESALELSEAEITWGVGASGKGGSRGLNPGASIAKGPRRGRTSKDWEGDSPQERGKPRGGVLESGKQGLQGGQLTIVVLPPLENQVLRTGQGPGISEVT